MTGTSRSPSVAIVGAGFSGIAMAIALRREGLEDVTLYERADDLGGVWHHNTYPGAACDVPSYLYSFSYEQRRDWSQPCSPQAEILEYLHATARKHAVTGRILTGTEIARTDFDEGTHRWRLEATDGRRFEADVLVVACGQLSRPARPRIDGIERFAGHSFHSAEWDHDHDLRGKRVAVVGSGASAIQFVPEIAQEAAMLHVFQRTPAYLLPRSNPRYPRWIKSLIRLLPGVQAARRHGMLLFMEAWIAGLTRFPPLAWPMRAWSWLHRRRQVRDPELRRKLTPSYPFGCKRILFSSYWYPALQRPNVELVTERIAAMTERGIVTEDGAEREVDTVIYGTGFATSQLVAPMEVRGLGGRELSEAWRDGAEAHLGITVSGFPNLFLLYGPNTNLGVGSIIVMIEAQVAYVVDALRTLRRSGVAAMDVLPGVQAASGARLQERLGASVWMGCDSWYRTDAGRVTTNWPGLMTEYVRATRAVDPGEYRLIPGAAAAD
jgi:cation diffusion facilitator CzcD-associated flavoprotein CzcO